MGKNKTTGMKAVGKPKMTSKYLLKRLRESWQYYVLLAPGLLYLLIFSYGPMYGVQIAFKDFRVRRGYWGSDWVGFKHFIRFFENPMFWDMIKNTLSISVYGLILFPIPVIFALLLNEIRRDKVKKTVQMITYMPHFLSEVVVCALVILFLDRTTGPIMNIIAAFGGERVNLMAEPKAFSSIYALSGLWQSIGWSSILYVSALSSISPDLIDAARIDGANRFQIIRHVNLPGIMPTVMITFILAFGNIMSVGYSKVLLLQNDLNRSASNMISTYTYEIGILGGQYSYSTAIGLFNNVINIILLLTVNRIVKKVTDTGLF